MQVQSEILLLIKELYETIKTKDPDLEYEFDDKKSKKILKHIRDLSQYLINQKSKASRDLTKGLTRTKDKYQYLSSESLNNLRAIIKRFIIYEIYKVVNPHRIAGETRKQTFIHNVILRGMEQAKHFEGGTDAEIETYGERMIRNLEKKNRSFARTKNLFR